jgi:multidrug efflux pump subunit AcrA (membrane-fusion protein)
MRRLKWLPLLLLPAVVALGCGRTQPQLAPAPPPEVQVATPLTRQVTDFEEYTGRTEAVNSVDVRARVSGYLDRVEFKDGDDIKEGAVIAVIDPRPYEAEVARTTANLRSAEAKAALSRTLAERGQALLAQKAIGQEEYDKLAGDVAVANSAIGVARAELDTAKLNLKFTSVTAPLFQNVAGNGGSEGKASEPKARVWRAGKRMVDPGNLVKADDTILTSLVQLDPMYASFDVDERSLLRFRHMREQGKVQSARDARISATLILADEEQYKHEGFINFVDNRVNLQTGSLWVRAQFPNPDPFFLSPGMFARIRVPIGKPHSSLLVAERALGTDQGRRFLYVLNDKDEVEYRLVKVGRLDGTLRVIDDGVAAGERVIITGLQRVRPGIKVTPKPVDMK